MPIKYPVACNPLAWSAGTVLFMLISSLGFKPEAMNHRLTLTNPVLHAWLNYVKIKDLSIGDSQIDLEFERKVDSTLVDIKKKRGDIKVIIEY